jgi:prepilin-type processing-associated H-X9-DG protein/prepilin-type N-terminal cleavage/methylation domain-containing protein
MRAPSSARVGGFTLIELSIVVAIAVVLTAIALPAFKSATGRANQAKCISNLREISSALSFFSMENNGEYPRTQTFGTGGSTSWEFEGGFWFNALGDYLAEHRRFDRTKVATGPFPQKIPFACGAAKPHGWGKAGIDVGLNGYILKAGNVSEPRVRNVNIVSPSKTLMVADSNDKWQIGNSANFVTDGISFRHNGTANVIFFDGHVSQIRKSQLADPVFLAELGGRRN